MRQIARAHRYRRLDAIASGGMGTVYLGRMMTGGEARTVAMKVLHPHLATDADMVAMFLDEARVATRLRHPNLVGVLDMDMIGEELVIVMAYVEASTLGTMQSALRKRGGKLPVGVTARVLGDALAGLHAMHELLDDDGQPLGLVHRDFSPHNLLVGSDGVTRVTDFGVALAAGRLAQTRPDGTVKGKLQYLAPEQIGRKKLDRRVDLFAAGIVLWECLTGERLFEAPTEAETVTRVLRDPIAPPGLHRPEVPTALDEVCLRALERDPDRRFPTAAAFAEALREALPSASSAADVGALVQELDGEAIGRQRDALARAAAPRTTRRPLAGWLAAAMGVGLVAAAALRWEHVGRSAESREAPRPGPISAARVDPAAASGPSAPVLRVPPPSLEAPTAPPRGPSPPETASAAASAWSEPPPRASAPSARAADLGAEGRDAGKHAPASRHTPRPARPFMPDDL